MTVIGKKSHAFYFNGVSDSITCSITDFSSTGITTKAGAGEGRSSRPLLGRRHEEGMTVPQTLRNLNRFAVEAWVRPDYGGVVASKDDLFVLTLGSVKEPGSASFTVSAQDTKGRRATYRVDSATSITGGDGGIHFPIKAHSSLSNDDVSRTSAPLIHIAGVFTPQRISLLINGETVASTAINQAVTCNVTASDFIIGGKGGQFRGYIESVHWRRGVDATAINLFPFVKDDSTVGLWRFEEDIDVDETVYHIKSGVSAGASVIVFDSDQIQSMYQTISGKSDTLTGVYNVPSLGKYKVAANTHSGGAQVIDIDHTPWNLIINPTGTDIKTGKPNNKPPERVRITQLNATANRITVNSVHLDFETSTDTGLRGVLHGRTAFDSTNNLANDSTCVLVKSDILIDTGTDDFTQTHGLGSQGVDTTGIIVRDESNHGFHGYLYNRRMSIDKSGNPFTISSGNWGVKDRFQVGHTARHCLNYVAGHEYLRVFPNGKEIVTQTMDGLADMIDVSFDGNSIGLREQVGTNTPISVFKSAGQTSPHSIVTSSTAKQVIRNGLSTLDPDRDSIIAIGGAGFDVRPFLLKGYPIDGVTQTDDVYNLHLTPETESRVAVLETGDADFPLVEIHYNAIDLTGDTMGTSGPCLLVQKTVPAGGTLINSKRVAATIASAISGGKKLQAPGGLLTFSVSAMGGMPGEMSNYSLVGDNTGGTLFEIELDKSMIPSNYTPRLATDDPQSPPVGISSTHSHDSTHSSVYHKMIMRPNTSIGKSLIDTDDEFALAPTNGNQGSANLVNRVFEVFDIITNYQEGPFIVIVVQPSNRARSLSLLKTIDTPNDPLLLSTEFLITRGRITSFKETKSESGSSLSMMGRGLMDDVASMEANFSGEGAPDSTIVKEVSPDAPVVSVTLGGPGQGAVLTQPTWDKSVLSRMGWSSRRDGGARVRGIDNSSNYNVEIINLNNNTGFSNNSDTIDAGANFGPRGRFYLPSGANFEYYKLSARKFYFHSGTGHVGTGRFKDSNGIDLDSFAAWQSATGLAVGDVVVIDDKFDEDSIVPDGTTINDRLFQTLNSVSHDYQLGTQYASTRAMVEIPIFSNQFFNDPSKGTFPSPGNSMKLHIDATMTAHTWAPNPVGRRPEDFYPPDRDVEGPYHKRLQDGDNAVSIRINKIDAATQGTGSITSNGSMPSGSWPVDDSANVGYTITDARGTSKTYLVNLTGTTGALDGNGNVIIGNTQGAINTLSSTWYTNFNKNLKAAIESANGHNGTIVVEDFVNGTILNLRETVYGNKSDDGSIVALSGWDNNNLPTITQISRSGYVRIYAEDLVNRIPSDTTLDVTGTERKVKGMRSIPMLRRVFTPDGEWGLIQSVTDATVDYLQVQETSKGFLDSIKTGSTISLLPFLDFNGTPIRDDTRGLSSANEFRRPFYYDRGNVQTQGGNIDYGLRQYVSAVEFKAGPETNPHAKRIQTKTSKVYLSSSAGGAAFNIDSDTIPIVKSDTTFTAINTRTGGSVTFTHNTASGNIITVTSGTAVAGDTLSINGNSTNSTHQLNRTWNYPYAQGGLRSGDTVWMNMHYTNPHAIDGMFCKSRGVFNQYEVWNGFNGGEGELTTEANTTIPLENFLIGNTCRETANNFVQHVNQTVSLNWQQLGNPANTAPVVAYLDPYLDTDEHARVLLYDVAHDKEFIAFHDLFMQVQTSQGTPTVNGLDVAAGFRSQINTSNRSDFIESAYAHRSYYLMNPSVTDSIDRDAVHDHYVDSGTSTIDGATGRLVEATVSVSQAEARHEETTKESASDYSYNSTFFDTPDGTRAIPAFLCLRGIRATSHDLSSHAEDRLQHLPHWRDMDFVRRQTIDFGDVAIADGVSDIESAAAEIIRRINQNAALQATSNGGSAHDPAAFWDTISAATQDRGTHMGYVRAHLGRAVKDIDGNEGFSIIIHSTVPGASGRNFCTWLDNSTGQVPYKPEYLIGHGGRFRNSWCLPPEGEDENMHPAPMPINKNGRPFAPITTLRQLVPIDEADRDLVGNLHFGYDSSVESTGRDGNDEMTIGRAANTVYDESFESQGDSSTLVEGLRTGTRAQARINFGGLVASGVPGWAPDAGRWGFGEDGKSSRLDKIYNPTGPSSYTAYVPSADRNDVSDREMYGLRFTDHRGVDHTVRLLYRQEGQAFAGKDTQLPSTLENEIVIHFDDRDVSQGGFTIGKNMQGSVHPDRSDFPAQSWRGNEWKGVKAPANGYAVSTQKAGSTLTLHTIHTHHPSYVDASNGGGAIDTLGFLGFPDSGLLVYTDVGSGNGASTTTVVHYTSRTHNDDSGPHKFYGITGPNFSSASVTQWATSSNTGVEGSLADPAIISPSLNWTTILTDEVIAAAVEHAMSVDPNEKSYLDISDMYATDGTTFKSWMGENAKTAVCVTTFSNKKEVTPLKDLFSVTRRKDLGLLASCLENSTAGTSQLTLTEIEAGKQDAVGYLPFNILDIRTKARGPNANTATPLLINSANQAVNTTEWKSHLTGDRYMAWPGDHILPCIETHIVRISGSTISSTTHPNARHSKKLPVLLQKHNNAGTGLPGILLGGPVLSFRQSEASHVSYTEERTMYIDEDNFARGFFEYNSSLGAFFTFDIGEIDASGLLSFSVPSDPSFLYSQFKPEFAGYRFSGNVYGEPLTYFRGGQSSPDHSVPLYFGGGFSGLVMDINDGTQNDYTEFYSHPYAAGPTGCTGLQNIGENMGAHTILDTTAMLAMFPGTALLNQHRGENTPPFMNSDAVLAPDLKVGTSAQTLGISSSDKDAIYKDSNATDDAVPLTHPTPVVLRFAHPYSRYTDTVNEVAYVVFGPGQSVPKHFNQYTEVGTVEPSASQTVAEKVTHVQRDSANTYFSSGTMPGFNLPNEMGRSNTTRAGIRRYMPPTLLYQKTHTYPYSIMRNWEPAYGAPSSHYNQADSEDAYLITNHFGDDNNSPAPENAHPFSYGSTHHSRWHMDGGFPAGGNWFDYAVRKNPPHPTTTESTKHLPNTQTHALDGKTITLGLQASMFRVGYVALTTYDSTLSETTPPNDVFIVDATKVQNSEELGAVISAAINSYPGEGNLKAIGGTFLPSFQDAVRQDRYSWVDLGDLQSYTSNQVKPVNSPPPSLPPTGWLRLNRKGGSTDASDTFYGYYSSFTGSSGGASISSLSVISGGNGYTNGSALSFSGGGGSSAAGTIGVTFSVASLATSGGAGAYSSGQTSGSLTFSGGGGSGAAGTWSTSNDGAPLTSVTISNAGDGYTDGASLSISGGGGSSAAGTIQVAAKAIASLSSSGGSEAYTGNQSTGSLSFSGGGGSGATGTYSTTSNGRPVASIAVDNAGSGYTSAPTVTIAAPQISGTTAQATAVIANTVTGVTISNNGGADDLTAGSGSLSFSGGGGSGAAGTWTANGSGAPIASVTFTDDGTTPLNHTTHGDSFTVTIANHGAGSGAVFTAYVGYPLKSSNTFRWLDGSNPIDPYLRNKVTDALASEGSYNWSLTALADSTTGVTHQTAAAGTFGVNGSGQITSHTVSNVGKGFVNGHGSSTADKYVLLITSGLNIFETFNASSGGSNIATQVILDTISNNVGNVRKILVTNGGSNYAGTTGQDSPYPVVLGFHNVGNVQTILGTHTAYTLPADGSTISITNNGAGYTSTPSVTINGAGFSGSMTATMSSTGVIKQINVTTAGLGYTTAPTVTLSGGGGDGGDASSTLGAEVRSLSGVTLTNAGSGYTSAPTVSTGVTDGGTVTATLSSTGPVSGVTLSNNGSGYTSAPTVTASGGSNLSLTPVLGTATRSLSSVNITNAGQGYSSAPTVSTGVSGGGTVTATLANTGPITSVTLSNAGSGYTSAPTITIGGGGSGGSIGATLAATGFFTLANNARSNTALLESPTISGAGNSDVSSLSDTYRILVWTKAGNLRWSNGAPETLHNAVPTDDTNSIYDQLAATQVHFSGLVDAIDRTRPIGAVGWHGERYSMLNSLVVPGTSGIASGLGAWHASLGTNPYGSGMSCHARNGYPFVTVDDTSYTPTPNSTSAGVHPRHYVIISNEAELPIIARADRDGLVLAGDMLDKKWNNGPGGTVKVSHSARHNNDRFVSYAHGGPHIDAQFAGAFSIPSSGNGEWAGDAATTAEMAPMETCIFPTGDLFFDKVENPGLPHYPDEVPLQHISSDTTRTLEQIYDAPFSYWGSYSSARNFLSQHIVWKRMDGGNLCMPSPNARGLGAMPWTWRKIGSSHVKFGETIYGNNRFSFESTNSAMFPVVQAQELMQPHLAEQFSSSVKNALIIPNEEIQFQAITVIDDAGQEHTVEGGSPLGTIVRDFQRVSDRDIKGPPLAGSGEEPVLRINLPHPDTIPGNLVVRSGFDKVQAYQHESMGTGGLQRPNLPDPIIKSNFNSTNATSDTAPFYENEGYERVDTRASEYPFSREGDLSNESILETSYEPHDRGIYFHLTKKSFSYTQREPVGYSSNTLTHNPLTFVSAVGTTVTVNTTVNADIWRAEQLPDGRSFFTVNGHIVSFTGVSGLTFTGCKYSTGFSASSGDALKPSFFVPSGTTRHFASRRLRDHSEVSGESPDKKPIDWMGIATNASPATAIRNDRLTPMPLPRMGHHYVTPTMAMMPGHLAHPLYQRLYDLNRAYKKATTSIEKELGYTDVANSLVGGSNSDGLLIGKDGIGTNALLWFSSTSAPHPPSDIHGSGFTLMTETKMKYDGYGILSTATENATGGHRLALEAGTNYRTHWNFPDPMETGAYQIIIQPNLYSQQLMGFSENYDFGSDTGTKYPLLTDQQVATVVALQWNGSDYDFILAEAIQADVRGCEVYLNEVMLDIDPSPNQQFTNLPPLALYNPLGINENTSPIWSRKSLPYRPGMFRMASPGYTLTVPWWAPALKSSDSLDASNAYRMVDWHRPEDYYLFSRSGYGSVGSQNVMDGYPSHFLHPYTHSYMSHVAKTEVKAADSSNSQLVVLNNSLFPEIGNRYMGHRLVVTASDGSQHTAAYTHRGVSSGAASQTTNVFYGVVPSDATKFWAAATEGAIVKITGEHGTLEAGEVYTNKTASVLANIIEDLQDGTQDTQTGHLPDAYLSMWHYNLGRPVTFYSDSRNNIGDAAVDKKPYNHMPEHFETIRYQNFTYAISDGPFDFRGFTRSTTSGPVDNSANPDTLSTPQARTSLGRKHHYGAFWPGGSRFGAQASDLALWGTAGPGWGRYWDNSVVYQESGTAGQYEVKTRSAITDSIDSVTHLRNASFGYRFCVRQAPNRPKWALWSTQTFDDKYSNNHSGYRFGVYVQSDAVTTTQFKYAGGALTSATTATSGGHTGMLERVTNASALVGSDLKLQQVRYSHGRRMTRPFGCAVRNYIGYDEDSNANGPYPVVRAHQGDYLGNIGNIGGAALPVSCYGPKRSLAPAIAHYMTDWWGNTTGEEVRRFPVRGFGVRPAWDPEDAYRATDRTKTAQTFAAPTGRGLSRANLDLFDPATAKRVGDRGDGRGVRWPTVFNEDVLQDVDIDVASSGIMLSHSTTEPPIGTGYVRARNDDLQITEVQRGISRRLNVADADGLLKPEAMAGANVEKTTSDLLPASETLQEPISRISPRIGLDVNTVGEINDTSEHDYVALATEAHSLHTDRGAGKRHIMAAGVKTDTKAVDDYRLDSLNFSNFKQVMRLNHTHGIWPLGGNLIMDLSNYMEPVSDLGWGNSDVSGSNPVHKTSNPYQTASHNSKSYRTNDKDRNIRLLLRPVRVLDHRHVEVFRDTSHALSGTAGGRYGVFTMSAPNARAATSSKFLRATNPSDTNAPYPPTYFFTSSSYTAPSSTGPRIPGSESSTFSNSLKQTVTRIIVSNNTLQHMRGDAARNNDFEVQPRYTQSLYAGDNLNTSVHSNESSRDDNEVNG